MKTLGLFFFLPFILSGNIWLTNLDQAEQAAQKEQKFILLNFSGSDWCGPCIRMHKDILDSDVFLQLAQKKLVLVNADFPRLKKNQLSKSQQQINDRIADQYNPKGIFPLTLLLDDHGKVLRTWEGYYQAGAYQFTDEVKTLLQNNAN
ncbi:MAG: redoxin domain-containing protein [Terrimonas sp.]|nr:redoxin domain-containing protein [Terrimonas sp.]